MLDPLKYWKMLSNISKEKQRSKAIYIYFKICFSLSRINQTHNEKKQNLNRKKLLFKAIILFSDTNELITIKIQKIKKVIKK